MNTNLPQTTQRGFINKIKAWLMKLKVSKNIKTNSNEEIIIENNDIKIQPKQDFLEAIKKQTNIACQNIQEKLRNGEIKAADLSDEEYEELIELYENRIRELTNKVEANKEKIEKLRKV